MTIDHTILTFFKINWWAKEYDSRCEVYYILQNMTDKYNL